MTTTITESEFINALKNADIEIENESTDIVDGLDFDGNSTLTQNGRQARIMNVLGVQITRLDVYNFMLVKPSTVTFEPHDVYDWEIETNGVTIVGEAGELDEYDIQSLAKKHTDIDDFDESGFADSAINADGDNDMTDVKTITVTRDDAPDIKFVGEKIASASSRSAYNDGGRWTVLKLYKTRGGKYVCQQIGETLWEGERTRYSGAVCETVEEVIKFFGHGRLAKDIYEESGIDAAQHIE